MSSAYGDMLGHPATAQLFAAPAVVRAMLRLERELVLAQAELGLVAADHAQTVAACCEDEPDHLQAQELVAQAAASGSLAIPVVNLLKAHVRERDAAALVATHLGATSQDLIDTAMSLQGQQALALIDAQVQRVLRSILRLAQSHGSAPLLARTLMQPALPTVLEARLLNWALPLQRCREQLTLRGAQALTLQLAGPVGTGAAWGERGVALRKAVAHRLGLPLHAWAWQVQRDEVARLAAELGVLVGAMAKVAADVALMSQAEVGELQESTAPGRGGSSAMSHKRNPVGAMVALAALHRAPQRVAAVIGAMAHEHERALGPWQAEGAEWADLFVIAAGACAAMADALEHASVDPARMAHHLHVFMAGSAAQATHGAPRLEAGPDALQAQRAVCWAELARRLSA